MNMIKHLSSFYVRVIEPFQPDLRTRKLVKLIEKTKFMPSKKLSLTDRNSILHNIQMHHLNGPVKVLNTWEHYIQHFSERIIQMRFYLIWLCFSICLCRLFVLFHNVSKHFQLYIYVRPSNLMSRVNTYHWRLC